MTHGSLFSGIGGFDLAAEWMDWENLFHCEWNPFGQQVLKHYWPNAKSYGNIDTTDFSIWRGLIDVLSGGFPCQPYSTAGKRKGKADSRHKWPQMRRAIREIQPSYIVPENVRGLTNWNGGLVFDEIQADLEAEGYEVLPFLLPACGVNAPHRRDRIFFIAYSAKFRRQRLIYSGEGIQRTEQACGEIGTSSSPKIFTANSNGNGYGIDDGFAEIRSEEEESKGKEQWEERNKVQRKRNWSDFGRNATEGIITDANSHQRCERRLHEERPGTAAGYISPCDTWFSRPDWENFPTQSPICFGNDGLSSRLARITVPGKKKPRILTEKQSYNKWRKEAVEALGNAIVPQVAFQIFKAIEAHALLAET